MKWLSRAWISGLGSALALYPPRVTSVSELRAKRAYADIEHPKVLDRVYLRRKDAANIRKLTATLAKSSVLIESRVKALTREQDSGEVKSEDSLSDKLRVQVYQSGSQRRPAGTRHSVYADGAPQLSDMLAIREDWQKVSCDLASANRLIKTELHSPS
jgi:hypothetical protein